MQLWHWQKSGLWFGPLWKISWDDDIPNTINIWKVLESHKSHVPNHRHAVAQNWVVASAFPRHRLCIELCDNWGSNIDEFVGSTWSRCHQHKMQLGHGQWMSAKQHIIGILWSECQDIHGHSWHKGPLESAQKEALGPPKHSAMLHRIRTKTY